MIATYIAIIIGLILLDQLTKYIVLNNMKLHENISVMGDFFQITSHRNKGAAWGMLQNRMDIFFPITIIVLIVLSYLLIKEGNLRGRPFFTWGVLLMIAGTIGNFIDRVWLGEVVDFLNFNIFGYDFPIFNVADMCLTIGVGSLIVYILFFEQSS